MKQYSLMNVTPDKKSLAAKQLLLTPHVRWLVGWSLWVGWLVSSVMGSYNSVLLSITKSVTVVRNF